MEKSPLRARRCVPCEGGVPPLSKEDARQFLIGLPQWTLSEDGRSITRSWAFDNMRTAAAFIQNVADIAEVEQHHPDVFLSVRRVRLELSTHSIGGLSENDMILAAKIDDLPEGTS